MGRPKGSVNAKPGERRPVGRPKGSVNSKPDLAWPRPKKEAAPPKSARAAWEHKQKLAGKASAPPMQSHAAAAAAAAATAVLPLRKRLPDPKKGWSQPYQASSQQQSTAAAPPEDHAAFEGPPAIEAVAPRKQNTGMLNKNSGQLADAARRLGEKKQSAGMEARAKRMADAKANAPAGGGPGAAADGAGGDEAAVRRRMGRGNVEEEGMWPRAARVHGGELPKRHSVRTPAPHSGEPFLRTLLLRLFYEIG